VLDMPTPLNSQQALDRYFLELRCRLLDLAAILDRIERGGEVLKDVRLTKVREALEVLAASGHDRAERIQHIFSREYDPTWREVLQPGR
jgi:hypothetical protein